MIKTSTKLFTLTSLLLLIIGSIVPDVYGGAVFRWLAFLSEIVFIFFLLIENKKQYWLYSVALILILLKGIGSLFKIMHWPFAGPMLMCGILGTMMMACLFLYNSKQATRYGQFILSIFLFLQLSMLVYKVVFDGHYDFLYFHYLYYAVALLCSILLFKKKYVNPGDRSLILYLLVYSLLVILHNCFKIASAAM